MLGRADTLLTDLAGGEDAPADLLRTRAAALWSSCTTYMTQGDLAAAEAAADQARDILAKLAAADPGNAGWQRDLSVSWNKLGDVRHDQGDLAGALQAYTASQGIREKLAAADPGNAGWQRDLSVSWESWATCGRPGRPRRARSRPTRRARASRESWRPRTRATPAGSATCRSAGTSWATCARPGRPRGRAPGLRPRARASPRSWRPSDPGNAGWQRDLSVSWEKLGDVRHGQGDLAGALQAYTASQGIAEKLAAADPGNAGWQRDLAVSWERIASAREKQGERAAARDAWRRALAICLPMATAYRDSVDLVTTPVVHLAGAARNLAGDDRAARAELAASMAELLPLLCSLARRTASMPGAPPGPTGWSRSWRRCAGMRDQP